MSKHSRMYNRSRKQRKKKSEYSTSWRTMKSNQLIPSSHFSFKLRLPHIPPLGISHSRPSFNPHALNHLLLPLFLPLQFLLRLSSRGWRWKRRRRCPPIRMERCNLRQKAARRLKIRGIRRGDLGHCRDSGGRWGRREGGIGLRVDAFDEFTHRCRLDTRRQ